MFEFQRSRRNQIGPAAIKPYKTNEFLWFSYDLWCPPTPQGCVFLCPGTVWFPHRLPRNLPRLVASLTRPWSKSRWHLIGWFLSGMVFTSHKRWFSWMVSGWFMTYYDMVYGWFLDGLWHMMKWGFPNYMCFCACGGRIPQKGWFSTKKRTLWS